MVRRTFGPFHVDVPFVEVGLVREFDRYAFRWRFGEFGEFLGKLVSLRGFWFRCVVRRAYLCDALLTAHFISCVCRWLLEGRIQLAARSRGARINDGQGSKESEWLKGKNKESPRLGQIGKRREDI